MPVTVEKASPEDIETLQKIGRETFFETFAESNSTADMEKYLNETFATERVMSELNNPESQFYIAREDGITLGYLKVNTGRAQTELQDENGLEIERIYVKSSHHGKSVGQLLYAQAESVAAEQQRDYIWLGVWEENPRAIRFYEKNGFVAFDTHLFMVGDDEQTDVLMKKILT